MRCNLGLCCGLVALALALPGTARRGHAQDPAPSSAAGNPPSAKRAPVACLIEPHRISKIAAPVAALLDQVFVDRGAVVTRGMLLAHLTSDLEEAEVAQARVHAADDSTILEKQARRDFTEKKRDRLERLKSTSQYVSPTTFEEAEADAHQAQAELKAAITQAQLNQIDLTHATIKLEQRRIRAPFDGVVTERSLSAGEYAYEQAPILTIAEIDPLNVEAYLPISWYGNITVGAQAEIRPEAPIGGRYSATVTVVDAVFDSRSSTFGIRLALPNTDHKLPANIRCEAIFSE